MKRQLESSTSKHYSGACTSRCIDVCIHNHRLDSHFMQSLCKAPLCNVCQRIMFPQQSKPFEGQIYDLTSLAVLSTTVFSQTKPVYCVGYIVFQKAYYIWRSKHLLAQASTNVLMGHRCFGFNFSISSISWQSLNWKIF